MHDNGSELQETQPWQVRLGISAVSQGQKQGLSSSSFPGGEAGTREGLWQPQDERQELASLLVVLSVLLNFPSGLGDIVALI